MRLLGGNSHRFVTRGEMGAVLPDTPRRFGARYCRHIGVRSAITAFSRHPPVTEGRALPPQRTRSIPLRQSRVAEWIVPPVIVPLLLAVMVIAVAIFHA
jgi:hypothetical protein